MTSYETLVDNSSFLSLYSDKQMRIRSFQKIHENTVKSCEWKCVYHLEHWRENGQVEANPNLHEKDVRRKNLVRG